MTNNTKLMMTAAMVGLSSAAQGAVTFMEATDFGNNLGTSTTLAAGTDQVIGEVNLNSDQSDFFTLQGFTPGSVSIDFERTSGSDFLRFEVYDGDTSNSLGTSFNQTGSFTVNAPASGNLIFGVQFAEGGGGSTGYSFTTTDVVPEPSTSALMSLAALAALSRRKRQ